MSNPGLTSVAKSAVFAAANLTDLLEIQDGESGNDVELTTDNAQTVNAMFVDSIKGTIQITFSDLELSSAQIAVLFIGRTGSLAVAYARRAQGKGFVAAKTHTITYANAQVKSIQRHAAVTGTGTLTVTWQAYDPAGTAVSTQAVA